MPIMKMEKRFYPVALFLGLIFMASTAGTALAQNGGGGGGGGGGQGGFGQGQMPDPAQIQQFIADRRQQMMDNIKLQLGASDEEFAIIQPKIQKVMDQQQNAGTQNLMIRAFTRGTQFAQFAGILGGNQQSPVLVAADELQKLLENPVADPDAIKVKLDTLRQARSKAREDLNAAREDLKSVLTLRQEAVLVNNGLLE
jgi:hypothetical protein